MPYQNTDLIHINLDNSSMHRLEPSRCFVMRPQELQELSSLKKLYLL